MSSPSVLRIRLVDGDLIGTTAFFRNRAFLKQIGVEIAGLAVVGRPVEIFVHACSIGAEVYSLAIHLQIAHPEVDFRIYSTDISPMFLKIADNAIYPASIVEHLPERERAFFSLVREGSYAIGDKTRSKVVIESANSFVNFTPNRIFDVVSLCNALVYVQSDQQAEALGRIAGYNRYLLALTGGHQETIANDLARNGYQPIMNGFKAINAGWTDRRRPPDWTPDLPRPPNVYTDAFLPPIDDAPGWQYRHGALFRKQAVAQAA